MEAEKILLLDFIKTYDNPESIVLLEGKRSVPEEEQKSLISLGKLLASATKHILFRSGNAPGADYLFSKGVASVDSTRLQVIVPYKNHRQKENLAYSTVSLNEINLLQEPEVVYESKANKKTAPLIDKYVSGDINSYTIKASYIIRDTVKVLGAKDIPPATFAIFYDDLSDPRKGGTGHTIHVCEKHGVCFIDQTVWMSWL